MPHFSMKMLFCLIVLSIMDFGWLLSEVLSASGISDSNDTVVFGHVEDRRGKGYVYFTGICSSLYFIITRIVPPCKIARSSLNMATNALVIAATSAGGVLLFEVPVALLVYLVTQCRNYYMLRVQIASRIMHIIVVLVRVVFLAKVNVKTIRQRTSSTGRCVVWSCLLSLVYYAGAAGVLGLSILSLKDYKLINDYNPRYRYTSIIFLPEGKMPSTAVSNFPLGNTLSKDGATADHFVLLDSFFDLKTSQNIVESEIIEDDDDNQVTTTSHFLKAALDCKVIPRAVRPTRCTDSIQFNFRYDERNSALSIFGKVYFNCGFLNSGTCREGCPPLENGWKPRLVNIKKGGTNDSVVTTPWRDVSACGETPVFRDKAMSACRHYGAGSFTTSNVVLILCTVVLQQVVLHSIGI